MTLKIAHIGAGGFSNQCLFPQYPKHDVELAAVCDQDAAKAERARGRFGFSKAYTDFRALLGEARPEAVICAAGPKGHFEVGMEVLERGIPLYVQKPAAPSAAQAREMADLAAKRGVPCHVGFNFRFATAGSQAKAILSEPSFGAPRLGVFRYGLAFGTSLAQAVLEQHCHLVDLARYLLGEPEGLFVTRSRRKDARDYVVASRFDSGAVVTLNFTSGQIVEKEFAYFEITGENSMLYSHGGQDLRWLRGGGEPWWREPQSDVHFSRGDYGHQTMLEAFGYVADMANFLAVVSGAEEDRSPIADAVKSAEMSEEILRQLGETR